MEGCDLDMELMPDYVHLLVHVDPQFGIAKLIRYFKGRSSRILRSEFPWLKSRLPTLWTNSYFVSTVEGAPISVIKQYYREPEKCLRKNNFLPKIIN